MTKIELFEQELQEKALIFKALSHPARLAILKYLADVQVCITGDITNELPLSRTTIHQHLEELKKTGLIKGQIEGVKTNYCLHPERIKIIKEQVHEFLDSLDFNLLDTNC